MVQGDLDDRASVERALGGVYGVFGVQNFWETGYERELRQGIELAEAALGAFARVAFEHPERWLGRVVDLAGDERSIGQVAEAFGRTIGRPVTCRQVRWDEYCEAAGEEYHDMFRWLQDVGYDADIPALRREYPQLTDFETYLGRAGWEGAARGGAAA